MQNIYMEEFEKTIKDYMIKYNITDKDLLTIFLSSSVSTLAKNNLTIEEFELILQRMRTKFLLWKYGKNSLENDE